MRKSLTMVLSLCLVVALAAGCKGKKQTSLSKLEKQVEILNNRPDSTLASGLVLEGCEYKQGDSLFTLNMRVPDDRLGSLTPDSLKKLVAKDIAEPGKARLIAILVANKLGLQYVYKTGAGETRIVFRADELPGAPAK